MYNKKEKKGKKILSRMLNTGLKIAKGVHKTYKKVNKPTTSSMKNADNEDAGILLMVILSVLSLVMATILFLNGSYSGGAITLLFSAIFFMIFIVGRATQNEEYSIKHKSTASVEKIANELILKQIEIEKQNLNSAGKKGRIAELKDKLNIT